ncbi:COX4, subunit IV of cytochrome c oxidase [Flagelloscypha sp. PMI_526]|nr:COX4, subunit IV of cytochrome c oxidase [Flagelloscypha sp. PMI_526]
MQSARALRLTHGTLQHACRRSIATTVHPSLMASSSLSSVTATKSTADAPMVPLGNIETHWDGLADNDKFSLQDQIDDIQKKDWKLLTLDEKKAAYFIAFGPHGPRAPVSKPGDNLKILVSVVALVGFAGIIHFTMRSIGGAPPKTMTREWQEASNERAKEMKLNPITGITSEGYSGKGFIQSK